MGRKVIVLVLAAALAAALLAGCGGKKESTGEVDGYVYVPAARATDVELNVCPEPYTPASKGVAELMPVEGARISVVGTSLEILTDSQGRFSLKGIPAGKQTLIVRYGALDPLIIIIDVLAGKVSHCASLPPESGETTDTSEAAGQPEPALIATKAFAHFVLSRERQPGAGTAVAALAAGADLHAAETLVTLPDGGASLVSMNETRARATLEQWNGTVLAARGELGLQPPAKRAVSVLRDADGRAIIEVATAARE